MSLIYKYFFTIGKDSNYQKHAKEKRPSLLKALLPFLADFTV